MKNKSVIFFDIDGTLLDQEKNLPISTREAIFTLKEMGHVVAIATGRAPFMFEDLRQELDINTYIGYNGSYVVLEGEVLYTNPLNISSIEKLTSTALQRNHPVVYMDHEDMKANVPEHSYIKESFEFFKSKSLPAYDPHYYKGRELYQAQLFCSEGEEKQYEQEFHDFDFVRWHPVAMDIVPKGGSKANGINEIAKTLGFSEEQLYAFGDGLNDIEMLSAVKNSVAMGNAEDIVKNVAKYVTKSVDDNGIVHGLQMVGLL